MDTDAIRIAPQDSGSSRFSIKSLAEVGVSVLDCEHKTPKFLEHGYPYIAIPNIQDGRLNLSSVSLISKNDLIEWTRRTKPQTGDLIVTRRGRVGDSAAIPLGLKCAIGQNLVILRSDGTQIDQRYLRWAMRGPMHEAQVEKWLNVGAVFDSLNVRDLPRFVIPVPPLADQRAIAHILGALDDKIEFNRQMNQTLEQIAAALFTSWFVDFDPVRAKAEGRQPEGMDEKTAALFPDRLVEPETGEIPEGWLVASLEGIARYLNGLALQKYPPDGESWLPVIKIAQLRKGNTGGADRASTQLDPDYIVRDGDVLFSWSGSLEVEIWTGGAGALNQHLFKVTSDRFPKWFYYHWTRHHLPWFRELARDKATTMGHIQRRHLAEAKALVPPADTLGALDEIMRPIMEKVVNNSLQARSLASLRDALLPRLLSGELRVPTDVLDEGAVQMQTPPDAMLVQSGF